MSGDGSCVVAVDIGNSTAKLMVSPGSGESEPSVRSFRIDALDWASHAVSWVDQLARGRETEWRIGTVHQNAGQRLGRAIAECDPRPSVQLVSRHEIPLPVDVDFPDRVGIDRLLSAFAGTTLATGPFVVVDAGSAVTVDWVDARPRFCGGAIFPGLRLQTTSLATGTDALPHLNWLEDRPLSIPGRNTLDAIHLGVLLGVSAAVDRLVARYCERLGVENRVEVLVTGGDAPTLSPHLECSHRVEANLVCRGLLQLPR